MCEQKRKCIYLSCAYSYFNRAKKQKKNWNVHHISFAGLTQLDPDSQSCYFFPSLFLTSILFLYFVLSNRMHYSCCHSAPIRHVQSVSCCCCFYFRFSVQYKTERWRNHKCDMKQKYGPFVVRSVAARNLACVLYRFIIFCFVFWFENAYNWYTKYWATRCYKFLLTSIRKMIWRIYCAAVRLVEKKKYVKNSNILKCYS